VRERERERERKREREGNCEKGVCLRERGYVRESVCVRERVREFELKLPSSISIIENPNSSRVLSPSLAMSWIVKDMTDVVKLGEGERERERD
jgi:hypothetical protein